MLFCQYLVLHCHIYFYLSALLLRIDIAKQTNANVAEMAYKRP